jgi:drug/metabolite transporter (DMT)-like permease
MKFEVNKLGVIPTKNLSEIIKFFMKALTNIGILSGFSAALIVAFLWISVLSKYEINSVYPYLSLTFVFVPILSVFILNESLNPFKIVGMLTVCMGVFIFSRGM